MAKKTKVSVVVPAWNEEDTIMATLEAVRRLASDDPYFDYELIVVDDCSSDQTFILAIPWVDLLVKHTQNQGKAAALTTGWKRARGEYIVFLDADVGCSAFHLSGLLQPIHEDMADIAVARVPVRRSSRFSFAANLAREGVFQLSGFRSTAMISGPIAVKATVMNSIGRLEDGYGTGVALMIDSIRRGYRVAEMDLPFSSKERMRNWNGIPHMGRQMYDVGKTLWSRWRNPVS